MSKAINRLVAYLFVPLIFTLIGFGIFFIALKKPAEGPAAALNLFVGESAPEFLTADIGETLNAGDIQPPSYGAFYANVYCERFNYYGKIYYGDSIRILKKGIGQKPGSGLPGYGGTCVLYGNNDGAFWVLEKMEAGDVIRIDTAYGEYQYRVSDSKVGYGDNNDELYPADDGNEMLVMCTQYPFKKKNKTAESEIKEDIDGTHKIVWAQKISGPIVIGQEAKW